MDLSGDALSALKTPIFTGNACRKIKILYQMFADYKTVVYIPDIT